MNPQDHEIESNQQPEISAQADGTEPVAGQAEPMFDRNHSDEPLPVCDYTGEDEAPCEEPATTRRWSGAAVVTTLMARGALPDSHPQHLGMPATVSISPTGQALDVPEAVAGKIVPSVVNITIQEPRTDPFTGESGFVEAGNGSGVIIRTDGYILTNYHVVQGATRVVVTVGVEDKVARIVGVDPSTDLAVIKVSGSGYPAVEIGSSKDMRVGQFVMAIGSPFGLEKTVTSGIVSALQRSEQVRQGGNDLTTYTNLIQTDAAINPGNSGGALVDASGRLVGINTLIQSPSGGVGAAQSAGIGFAIPVDFAVSIADQLITDGKASHPYLGVSTQTVDEAIAAQYQLPVQNGALVAFVQPDGPSDTAKIKRGDIIVKIGDTDVTGVADVFAAVRLHEIGDTVPVQLVRADQKLTVKVKLGPISLTYKGKGTYKEPESVAFQGKGEVDKSYVRCLKALMEGHGYPMVASHDPRIVEIAGALAHKADRDSKTFEYQMLYGIRPEEQKRIADRGDQMRVYVPYGPQWYGYLMRRLAEKPQNLAFFARSLVSKK